MLPILFFYWYVECSVGKPSQKLLRMSLITFISTAISFVCFLARPGCLRFYLFLTILSDQLSQYLLDRSSPICRADRTMAVDERSKVCFSIPQKTLPWQLILWSKSRPKSHTVVHVTFAKVAYDKKCKCGARRRQTNYLIRWTQTNQLTD